jgi:hypothetical protein
MLTNAPRRLVEVFLAGVPRRVDDGS